MTNINARTQFYLDNPNFILSVARKHHIPESDIDDFSQQVLLESLQHRCPYDKMKSAMERYAEIYVLTCIDEYRRKRNRDIHLNLNSIPAKTPTAEAILEKSETWRYIQELIIANGYTITKRQKQVMELLFDGNTAKQIAETLEISVCRIYKIQQQIQQKIEKKEKKRGRKNKNYPKNPEK